MIWDEFSTKCIVISFLRNDGIAKDISKAIIVNKVVGKLISFLHRQSVSAILMKTVLIFDIWFENDFKETFVATKTLETVKSVVSSQILQEIASSHLGIVRELSKSWYFKRPSLLWGRDLIVTVADSTV